MTVPFSEYVNDDLFYFPGCHVIHYKNNQIQDQMNDPAPTGPAPTDSAPATPAPTKDGDWQICFAAIPDKTMTIYYYKDDTTAVTPPWMKLDTTTANGMACADLVDFSAVYAPAAH